MLRLTWCAKGRLGPGEMLAVDLRNGKLLDNDDIHDELKARFPYKKWLKQGVRYLDSELIDLHMAAEPFDDGTLALYQKMFNLSREELNEIISVLAKAEQEAVGSMGDDTPMPVLSRKIRSPFDYFRQQFAQVTNPPIDSLRERIVMSLQTNIGRETSLFDIGPEHAHHVIMNSPVMSQRKLRQLLGPDMFGDSYAFIDLNLPKDMPLPEALDEICAMADEAVADGKLILMLSDRYLKEDRMPVHALAGHRSCSSPPGEKRLKMCCKHHCRDWRRPRCTSHCMPDRLRSNGGLSISRLSKPARSCATRTSRQATTTRSQLSSRHSQRLVQDHVEDGHILDFELSGRPAVRDCWFARGDRQALLSRNC